MQSVALRRACSIWFSAIHHHDTQFHLALGTRRKLKSIPGYKYSTKCFDMNYIAVIVLTENLILFVRCCFLPIIVLLLLLLLGVCMYLIFFKFQSGTSVMYVCCCIYLLNAVIDYIYVVLSKRNTAKQWWHLQSGSFKPLSVWGPREFCACGQKNGVALLLTLLCLHCTIIQ